MRYEDSISFMGDSCMKKLLAGLALLSSVVTFASSVEERAISVDRWCTKQLKINAGIYKIDKGCVVQLADKKAAEVVGICRGDHKDKSRKIHYKISFSTVANEENLRFHAVSDRLLWHIDEELSPEVSFKQPTWAEYNNQRYVIVNRRRSTTVSRGNETVINVVSKDIDLLFIKDDWGLSSNNKFKASIIVKSPRGDAELTNATCDLMIK